MSEGKPPRKLLLTARLLVDPDLYPERDDDWLVNDIPMDNPFGDDLILHSNTVGDAVGVLHVTSVQTNPA